MNRSARPRPGYDVSFILLLVMLGVLWIAGGASRADVLGQVITRLAAWGILIVWFVIGPRPALATRKSLVALLVAVIALPLLQLVPLPPSLWQALPGREAFMEASAASGQAQPWRPLSLVPGATLNALGSLVVPVTVLLLLASMRERGLTWLPAILLGMVAASTLLGLLQLSAGGFDAPFVNDRLGDVNGTFANRNHFALFLAMGCLIAPTWATQGGRHAQLRLSVALGLMLLFLLTILASGSRAGLLAGAIGVGVGLMHARAAIRRELKKLPRWVAPAVVAAVAAAIGGVIFLSITAGRARSLDRVLALSTDQDMRIRGLPTVLDIIQTYFPVGSGLGAFDPLFRMHEPFELLKPTYFNHAHNDFLEIVLDAGLPGLLLLVAGLGWWLMATVRAWRADWDPRQAAPKLGSALLLLVIVASVFDYPARTPMMMAVIVIAAYWLSGQSGLSSKRGAALPGRGPDL